MRESLKLMKNLNMIIILDIMKLFKKHIQDFYCLHPMKICKD
jgi:hypothetical protein